MTYDILLTTHDLRLQSKGLANKLNSELISNCAPEAGIVLM